ncbi:MAG: hypothetical protein VCA36_09340 [Opitutales bacterium]
MKTTVTKTHLILTTALVALIGFLGSGAFRAKSEAAMPVIQAGVDKSGNQTCVNKSQVYLFSKDVPGKRILFNFHDPSARDGFSVVSKTFSSKETLEEYWEILLKEW